MAQPPQVLSLRSHRLFAFMVCCILALWLAAFLEFARVSFFSRAILQYFAGGMSEFKPLFGLVWLLASAIVWLLAREGALSRIALRWILPTLVLAQALNLAQHFAFARRFNLNPTIFSINAIDREISSNQLIHTHVAKGVLYLLARQFGFEGVEHTSDPGRFYAEVLPPAILLGHGILVLGLLLLSLTALPSVIGGWRRAGYPPVAVAYVFASGSAVRAAIDGGPFDWTFLSLFPLLLAAVRFERLPVSTIAKRFVMDAVACFGILFAVHHYVGTEHPELVIMNGALSILFVFSAVLTAGWFQPRLQRMKYGVLSVASVTLLVVLSRDTFWAWDFRRWTFTSDEASDYYLADYYHAYDQLPTEFEEGRFAIRTATLPASAPLSDLFLELEMRMGFGSLAKLGNQCEVAKGFERSGRVIVIAGAVRPVEFERPIFESFALEACGAGEACSYRYFARYRGCIPDSISEAVVNRLYEMGLTRVILIPGEDTPRR